MASALLDPENQGPEQLRGFRFDIDISDVLVDIVRHSQCYRVGRSFRNLHILHTIEGALGCHVGILQSH